MFSLLLMCAHTMHRHIHADTYVRTHARTHTRRSHVTPTCLQATTLAPSISCYFNYVMRIQPKIIDDNMLKSRRDVLLNVSVSTPETRRWGGADHVCELQLILRSFAELKWV